MDFVRKFSESPDMYERFVDLQIRTSSKRGEGVSRDIEVLLVVITLVSLEGVGDFIRKAYR